MYNSYMLKLSKMAFLILGLIVISGCSQTQADATKECAEVNALFNEKLYSTENLDKIEGWQYVIDYPTCFTSYASNIAPIEIEALKNQSK